MDLFSISRNQDQRSVVDHLVPVKEEIEGHVSAFLARLAHVCDNPEVNRYWNTTVACKSAGTAAEITSPFGIAHIKLNLVIVDGKVEGLLSLRKEALDDMGRPSWPLVTSIRVTRFGIHLGEEQEHPIAGKSNMPGEDRQAYNVLSAVLYILGAA